MIKIIHSSILCKWVNLQNLQGIKIIIAPTVCLAIYVFFCTHYLTCRSTTICLFWVDSSLTFPMVMDEGFYLCG